jgi:hypothetical protein
VTSSTWSGLTTERSPRFATLMRGLVQPGQLCVSQPALGPIAASVSPSLSCLPPLAWVGRQHAKAAAPRIQVRPDAAPLASQQCRWQKLPNVSMRLEGVDQRLRARGPLFCHVLTGIEAGRPGVAQQVNVFCRMAACAQGPPDVVEVGELNIVSVRPTGHRRSPIVMTNVGRQSLGFQCQGKSSPMRLIG